MSPSGDAVLEFVSTLDLSAVPRGTGSRGLAEQPPRFVPNGETPQSVVVGSNVANFVTGVDGEQRRTLQNVMLLAHLAAKAKDDSDPKAWHARYFEVLTKLGLLDEERADAGDTKEAVGADVEAVVLEIAAAAFGGVGTVAYRLVKSSVDALAGLGATSPTLTIFRRESQSTFGRFQVSVAEPVGIDGAGAGSESEVKVTLLAFTFNATAVETQVLFFKTRHEIANVAYIRSRLALVEDALSASAEVVRQKVKTYAEGYVRTLIDEIDLRDLEQVP